MDLLDTSMLVVLIIIAIVLIIHILICVLFANKMQEITDAKNYDGSVWGWSFFLVFVSGIMGMIVSALMVNALPSTIGQKRINEDD